MLVQDTAAYWALINIVLVAIAVMQATAFLARYAYIRHNIRAGSAAHPSNAAHSGSPAHTAGNLAGRLEASHLAAVIGCISALVMAAVLFLTEDFTAPMRMADDLTVTMTAITCANAVLGFAASAAAGEDGRSEQEN